MSTTGLNPNYDHGEPIRANSSALQFPEKLKFLFGESRYKVAYGGRGSAKSWSFAKALLLLGASAPTRILCAREVQKSIKDSVHQLLKDQIVAMGLTSFYEVLETEIRGINGTSFAYTGLSSQTIDSVKSFEGCDICWVEEGQSVSKRSWDILTPTIRRPNSEIWVSLNPELDSDETYKRFVLNPPPNCISMEVNYVDNPWFPGVLEDERAHCYLTNREDYDTIWLGKCRAAVIGAIYAGEVAKAQREQRVCFLPYDPALKVHAVWDMGWNDKMFIILAQKVRSELRIIEVIEEDHKTLDWFAGELDKRNYNWGYDFLPHDAFHGDYKVGKTADKILKGFGRKTKPIPNIAIEDGIKMARMMFNAVLFDKVKAARLVECLKRLRRRINQQTQEAGSVLHDEYSHGGDAFRYLAIVADQMTNETDRKPMPKIQRPKVTVNGMGI